VDNASPKARPFVPRAVKAGMSLAQKTQSTPLRFSLMRRLRIASKIAILVTRDRISSRSARSPVCSMTATIFDILCALLRIGKRFCAAWRTSQTKARLYQDRQFATSHFAADPGRAGRRREPSSAAPTRPAPSFLHYSAAILTSREEMMIQGHSNGQSVSF